MLSGSQLIFKMALGPGRERNHNAAKHLRDGAESKDGAALEEFGHTRGREESTDESGRRTSRLQ